MNTRAGHGIARLASADLLDETHGLLARGREAGFLTHDDVNEHMPESTLSSDQMEDWLSAFSGEGIEVVDSSSKVKVSDKTPVKISEDVAADEDAALLAAS